MVRVPVSPSPQPRAPSAVIDITEPMVVVDSTFAESASSVDFSALRRAATGENRGVPSLPEPPEPPESPDPSEPPELQAATPVSRVTAAIERPVRRTVVLFIRSTPKESCVRTLTHGTDTRAGKRVRTTNRDEPRTSKGCGARRVTAVSCQAQTAAGSSSTRRLRVRFESTGMPGPTVVLIAAFLM